MFNTMIKWNQALKCISALGLSYMLGVNSSLLNANQNICLRIFGPCLTKLLDAG